MKKADLSPIRLRSGCEMTSRKILPKILGNICSYLSALSYRYSVRSGVNTSSTSLTSLALASCSTPPGTITLSPATQLKRSRIHHQPNRSANHKDNCSCGCECRSPTHPFSIRCRTSVIAAELDITCRRQPRLWVRHHAIVRTNLLQQITHANLTYLD